MQEPIPEPDRYKIACYGDSTQWGANGNIWYPDDNVPTLLGKLFSAASTAKTVTVVNHGTPGVHTLERLCGRVTPSKIRPW